MRGSICGVLALAAVAGWALPVQGQNTKNSNSQTAGCPVDPNQSAPVRHKPQTYTAEFKVTNVQTLGNGAKITQEYTTVQARDSQSRTLFATTMIQQYGDPTLITRFNVLDQANGNQTTWDSQVKKATILKEPPAEQRHGCWQSPSGNMKQGCLANPSNSANGQADTAGKASTGVHVLTEPQGPQQVQEDLGTATIQGIKAHGRRSTWTTPVGEIGNDQPLVHTQEDWLADGLGIEVRHVDDDPQQGKRTTELVKLDEGEPDPALFQPPEGYEIVTEEMVPCKEP